MAVQVLLVDDEAALLQTMKGIFLNRDVDVCTASSAKEAIQILSQRNFDLVVTDMRMETPLSGYDVVLAATAKDQKLVTVILSAFPIPAAEWKRAGADDMVLKGAEGAFRKLDEIIEVVRRRASKSPATAPEAHNNQDKVG